MRLTARRKSAPDCVRLGQRRVDEDAGPISPPVSSRTPLASLDGWAFVLDCAVCGPREKSVNELCAVVPPAALISDVLPKLVCDRCRSKPARMSATCQWARKWNPEAANWRLDLTPFLVSLKEAT
jgi:hypothetical protein